MPNKDVVLFVDEPPEFSYDRGLFHITYETGGRRIERVMRPEVFFKCIVGAVEVSRAHRMGNVVPLVAADDHAASASGKPSK